MAEINVSIELLLGIIATLACGQLAVITYFARKYIREIDRNSKAIQRIKSEHMIFHRDETGIKD